MLKNKKGIGYVGLVGIGLIIILVFMTMSGFGIGAIFSHTINKMPAFLWVIVGILLVYFLTKGGSK